MVIQKGSISLTFKFVAGISKAGYFQLSLLGIGVGNNGLGLFLLGFYFGIAKTKMV